MKRQIAPIGSRHTSLLLDASPFAAIVDDDLYGSSGSVAAGELVAAGEATTSFAGGAIASGAFDATGDATAAFAGGATAAGAWMAVSDSTAEVAADAQSPPPVVAAYGGAGASWSPGLATHGEHDEATTTSEGSFAMGGEASFTAVGETLLDDAEVERRVAEILDRRGAELVAAYLRAARVGVLISVGRDNTRRSP